MAKVVALMSMSLDGYVADPSDGVAAVFHWYFTSVDVEFHTGGADPMTFKVSGPTVHFLTDGIESVVTQARAAAAGKSVAAHGADTVQQFLVVPPAVGLARSRPRRSIVLYHFSARGPMRVSRAALVFVALPIALGAQQPTSNPVTAVMKQRTMVFQQRLTQAFDSIPERIFGYKPTPAQMTIGYIAQHLVDDNYFYCSQFGAMKGVRDAEDSTTPDSVKAKWPKDKLVAQLTKSFKFCEDALAQLDDAKLGDQVTQTLGNGQTRTVTRAGPVMGHIIDMADHYSQLSNYMRLNNILPPTALPRPRPPGGTQ